MPLNKLSSLELQEFYKKLLSRGRVTRLESKNQPKGLSPKTVCNIHREAKKSGVFELYYLDLATGLRRGELLGLKWTDIDLEKGKPQVKRQVAWIEGEIVEAPLKTKNAYRTLPLAEDVTAILKQQRKKTSAVPGCFPHPPAVYLTGQRPAYTPPGAETGGSASGQVPRFTAYIRTAGPPERGRCKNRVRDAGTLLGGIHPGHLRPRDHSLPAPGGKNHGQRPLWNSPALTAPRSRMGHGLGQTKTAKMIPPKK